MLIEVTVVVALGGKLRLSPTSQDIVETLVFTLSELGRYWRVLTRELTCHDLRLKMFTLAAVLT